MNKTIKKISKKVLATTLAVAVAVSGIAFSNLYQAKADTLTEGRVAYFTFNDDSLTNTADAGKPAKAMNQGVGGAPLTAYEGAITYEKGRDDAAGKAIRLTGDGGFGLDLNQDSIGKVFSLSVWLKPDGNFSNNQSIALFGTSTPAEHWVGLSGHGGGNSKVYLWGNGSGLSWTTLVSGGTISSTAWHHLVFVAGEDTMAVYEDGALMGETDKTNNPLAIDNGKMLLGVNFWDACFAGLVDDVCVYNRKLSEGEIERLYTNATPESALSKEGVALADVKAILGEKAYAKATIPAMVLEDDGTSVKYSVSDNTVATINEETGEIDALKIGSTGVKVTVKNGAVTKEATAKLTVIEIDDALVGSFSFENSLADATGGEPVATVGQQLASYSSGATYVEGRHAKAGKAIKLGKYGLDTMRKNVGDEFTVSYWLKPDGTLATNQAVMLIGSSSPEKWMGLAGNKSGSNNVKFWARGGGVYDGDWFTLSTFDIDSSGWHNLVFTNNGTKTRLYLDGELKKEADTSNPFTGDDGKLLIGATYWTDALFAGAVDDLEIYNIELGAKNVKNKYLADMKIVIPAELDKLVDDATVLGRNTSADAIKYDLVLPKKVRGLAINWESSDAAVISNSGLMIKAPTADEDINLTATVDLGGENITKTLKVKAVKLDRSELDSLLTKAKAIDQSTLPAIDKERLVAAIAEGEAVTTYDDLEIVLPKLRKLVDKLTTGGSSDIENPFAYIVEPEAIAEVKIGATKSIFEVPVEARNSVTVEYSSNDESVVKYDGGVITAGSAEGKAIVTATVTAKSDNFAMEYSTAVNVTKKGGTTPDPDGDEKEKELERNVATQDAARNDAESNKSGDSKNPVVIPVQQAKDDTLKIQEVYVKGKVKAYVVEPVSDQPASNVVTVNAGTKLTLNNGAKKSFRIVDDTNGKINKKGTGSASAAINAKGVVTLKAVKDKANYTVKVEYDKADGSGKYALVINVENVEFDKAIKGTVLYSVAGEVKNFTGEVVKTVDDTLATEVVAINLTDIVGHEIDSTLASGRWYFDGGKPGKEFATGKVAANGRKLTIKPIAGKKGTAKITVIVNGKKYSTSVTILDSMKSKLKKNQITPNCK